MSTAVNAYTSWTQDDIDLLYTLFREGHSVGVLARALGRSERAVHHAIKQMLAQQLASNGPDKIADVYNVSRDELHRAIAPAKYHRPIRDESPPIWCAAFVILTMAIVGYGAFVKLEV